MARILLVDDDTTLLEILADYLARAGDEVETAASARAAQQVLRDSAPDLVVLDVTMPEIDGWQLLEQIRETWSMPVIMLTARSDEPDVLRGFSLGADDYVAKPFSFAQLEARIRAVLARTGHGVDSETQLLEAGDLQVDLNSHRVRRSGELINLTPTEFRLLTTLMEQPGKVLSPLQLVSSVWGKEYTDEVGYIRRYIWHLRRKIEPDPDQPRYIHNERNVGYYFAAV
jgi:two-component system KDP operon response regulator KdpE